MEDKIKAQDVSVTASNLASTTPQRADLSKEVYQNSVNEIKSNSEVSKKFLGYSNDFLKTINVAVQNVAKVNASQHLQNYQNEVKDIMSSEKFMSNAYSPSGIHDNQEAIKSITNKYKDAYNSNEELSDLTPVDKERNVNDLYTAWQTMNSDFNTKINEIKIQRTFKANTDKFNKDSEHIENSENTFNPIVLEHDRDILEIQGVSKQQSANTLYGSLYKRSVDKIAKDKQIIQAYMADPTKNKKTAQELVDNLRKEYKDTESYQYLEDLVKEGNIQAKQYKDAIDSDINTDLNTYDKQMVQEMKKFIPQEVQLANAKAKLNSADTDYNNMTTSTVDKEFSTTALSNATGLELNDQDVHNNFSTLYPNQVNKSSNVDSNNVSSIYNSNYAYDGSKTKRDNDLVGFEQNYGARSLTDQIDLAKAMNSSTPGFYAEYMMHKGYGRPQNIHEEEMLKEKLTLTQNFSIDDLNDNTKEILGSMFASDGDGNDSLYTPIAGGKSYTRDEADNAAFDYLYSKRNGKIRIQDYVVNDYDIRNNLVNGKNNKKFGYSDKRIWNATDPDREITTDLMKKLTIVKTMRTNPILNAQLDYMASGNELSLVANKWNEVQELINNNEVQEGGFRYSDMYNNPDTMTQEQTRELRSEMGSINSNNSNQKKIESDGIRSGINFVNPNFGKDEDGNETDVTVPNGVDETNRIVGVLNKSKILKELGMNDPVVEEIMGSYYDDVASGKTPTEDDINRYVSLPSEDYDGKYGVTGRGYDWLKSKSDSILKGGSILGVFGLNDYYDDNGVFRSLAEGKKAYNPDYFVPARDIARSEYITAARNTGSILADANAGKVPLEQELSQLQIQARTTQLSTGSVPQTLTNQIAETESKIANYNSASEYIKRKGIENVAKGKKDFLGKATSARRLGKVKNSVGTALKKFGGLNTYEKASAAAVAGAVTTKAAVGVGAYGAIGVANYLVSREVSTNNLNKITEGNKNWDDKSRSAYLNALTSMEVDRRAGRLNPIVSTFKIDPMRLAGTFGDLNEFNPITENMVSDRAIANTNKSNYNQLTDTDVRTARRQLKQEQVASYSSPVTALMAESEKRFGDGNGYNFKQATDMINSENEKLDEFVAVVDKTAGYELSMADPVNYSPDGGYKGNTQSNAIVETVNGWFSDDEATTTDNSDYEYGDEFNKSDALMLISTATEGMTAMGNGELHDQLVNGEITADEYLNTVSMALTGEPNGIVLNENDKIQFNENVTKAIENIISKNKESEWQETSNPSIRVRPQ